MKKHYFIYTLLLAYSCSAFAVESTPPYEQSQHTQQTIESSFDDECDEDNDTEVEVPQKPTVLESWSKVVSLEWNSLSRDDAWNIGATATLAGVACYYLWPSYPKKNVKIGPRAGNQPPQDPFGGLTPEERQEQREALEAIEQRHAQELQARQEEIQRTQAETERIAQAQRERARQAALQQQQELQRRELQRLEEEARQEAERERLLQQRLQAQRQEELYREEDYQRRVLLSQQDEEQSRQYFKECHREEVMLLGPERIDERLKQLQKEIRAGGKMQLNCPVGCRGASWECRIYNCPVCILKVCGEVEQELIHEIYAQELQQKAAEKERQQQKQKINCTMCFEGKNLSEFHGMSCCNYSGCKECFIEMIDTHLNEHNTKDLNCPNQKCAKKIEEKDIHAITLNNKDVYERYLAITCKECLADDPHLKHCPSRDCPYAFINDQGIRQLMKCPECRQQYCSLCLVNHNVRVTCTQAKIERELAENPDTGQKANEKWINENTKPCPNCNVRVEKNGGCLWMLCAKCRHQFCWRCLKPHDHSTRHPCGLWDFNQ